MDIRPCFMKKKTQHCGVFYSDNTKLTPTPRKKNSVSINNCRDVMLFYCPLSSNMIKSERIIGRLFFTKGGKITLCLISIQKVTLIL